MEYDPIMKEEIPACAYKEESELTDREKDIWNLERARCQLSFLHFLEWVRIIRPPIPGQVSESIVPLELWKHTKEVIATLLRERHISVLKARQIGLSTIIAVYVTWYALSKVGANILLFSQGQDEAKSLLSKCRNVYDQLPNFMKFKLDPDSKESIGFPATKSVIKALPSTTSAGIGETASILVWDEHAKHEYADTNYTHAKPTIDGGGQVISVFTADPNGNDNLATALFEDALKGKNGFYPLFFPWDVIPGRNQEWYEQTERSIPERDLAKLSPQLYMAKNYPGSIEEALSTATSVAVFDKKVLNIMMEDVRGHINEGEEFIRVYKDYHVGNKYVAASDVSWGVGADFSVTGVMDEHGDIVADIMSNKLEPDEFTEHSVELMKHYHNPWWWIENNTAGGGRIVIKKAVELGYRKLGHKGDVTWSQLDTPEMLSKIGFSTNEKSRIDLFGGLITGINDMQLRIYNEQGLRHFFNMIRNSNKNGKIEATSSTHDDYVIMVGICLMKRKDMKQESMKPIETLTFNKPNIPSVIQRLIDRRQYAEA
ncbi:hypothetical protein LCGC14_1146520 [marine sediment metagenome]|uniref:Terminase large subunit gp17-like C-terminal domain-containing protein n=1 Tax=marine sediment metagenome TaxID=412755 RepID=A0A0F9M1J9_9ZZZZ